MKQTATFKFYASIIFLLIQLSRASYAQEQTVTANHLQTKKITINEKALLTNTQIRPVGMFTEWVESVTDYTLLNNNKIDKGESIEAFSPHKSLTNGLMSNKLFIVDKVKDLQQQINLRFQTGLYSLKNHYVLSSHHASHISHHFLVPNLAQHGLYQFGRFRTETGYSDSRNDINKNFKAFLHSAYSVIHLGRFDLSVTASIESFDIAPSTASLNNKIQFSAVVSNSQQSTSATLGVIGSFDLSNRWSLIGALTTSHLTNVKSPTLIVEEHGQKMALIGTTYSF